MTHYIIICAGCGQENHRYYLPERCRCLECGETYYVEEWRESEGQTT